jgi:O-antigen ligase/capsular polysaccharide biosynthesis protein
MVGLLAIVVGAIVGAAAGLGWTATRTPVYASTATLIVSIPTGDSQAQYEALRGHEAVAPMLAALAVTPTTVRSIAAGLGIPQDADSLVQTTSARAEPGDVAVAITARHRDPATAAQVANALANDLVVRTRPQGADAGSVTLVEPAVPAPAPETPVAPLNAALGSVVGAAIVAAAVVASRRRRRLAMPQRPALAGAPSGIGLGIVVGFLVLAAMGLGLPPTAILATGALAVAVAAASPGAGLAILVLVLPQQEPAVLGALGLKLPLIIALTFGTLVRLVAARSMPRVSVGVVAVVAYTALAALSAVPLLTGLDGDRGIASAYRFLQLADCVVLVVVATIYFARYDPRPHLVLAVASAALVAGLALLQLVPGGSDLPFASGLIVPRAGATIARVTGPFENPNYLSLFLGLALVLGLGLAAAERRLRPYLLPLIPVIAVGAAFTLSRGSLAATMCGILALVWLRSRVLASTAAVALVVAGLVVYPAIIGTRLERSATGGIAFGEVGLAASDAQRLDAVAAGLRIFGIDPVFGAGFGQYEFASTQFVGSSEATAAHNQYLKILAEQGVVGALAGAAAVLVIARALLRSRSPLRNTVLAMATAYVVGGAFLEPLTTVQASGFMALGAAAVVGGAELPQRVAERVRERRALRGVPEPGAI